MTSSMKGNTVVDAVGISPNPIDTGEAFIADVQARNRTKWADYSTDRWSGISALIWG